MADDRGKTDEVKGRVKEAAGALADDDKLRAKGKADRAAGSVKEKLADARDAAEDVVDRVRDKVKDTLDRK